MPVKKYEGAGYDYIGVNIYPDTQLKNTVEEKAAGKQMIISSVKCPWKDSEGKSQYNDTDKRAFMIIFRQRSMRKMQVD